jgi:hypothetical protein
MRQTDKNKVAEFLKKSEYGIDAFELYDVAGSAPAVTRLNFKGTELYCTINPFPNDFNAYAMSYTKYGPASPQVNPSIQATLTIDQVILHIASRLKRDLNQHLEDRDAPDLWEEYKNGAKYLKIEDLNVDDNQGFSADDQVRIKFAIADLKLLIDERFKPTEAQLASINKKLEYLVESTSRLSRTDWKGVTIGIVTSIAIALSLDTERGNQLWQLFEQVFSLMPLIPY